VRRQKESARRGVCIAADSGVGRVSLGRSNRVGLSLAYARRGKKLELQAERCMEPTDLQEYACTGSDLGNAEAPQKALDNR
jgi:hypothetical protein